MIILSSNGHKLIDAGAIFIREVKDRDDKNKTLCFKVVAVTNYGRPETMAQFDTIPEAEDFVKGVANECRGN